MNPHRPAHVLSLRRPMDEGEGDEEGREAAAGSETDSVREYENCLKLCSFRQENKKRSRVTDFSVKT